MEKQLLIHNATQLRYQGRTYQEIAKTCGVAVGTAARWVRGVKVSESGVVRLRARRAAARAHSQSRIASQKKAQASQRFTHGLRNLALTPALAQAIATSLYWPSQRQATYLSFTTCDAQKAKLFLNAMQKGFAVDTNQWKALLYADANHHLPSVTEYWSRMTGIAVENFSKPTVSTRQKSDPEWFGTIRLRLYNASIARSLQAAQQVLRELLQ